ncbi:stromal membrane-associated protein 1 isoform X1 [Trichogramma pretiosum]|uniref:stromal membrane-associated protein 1 isoform X1 n=1 Tax=Trichogramma pretiosum TaxID=7493 RepID=UPI0006C99FED|nr:stromal membrane-associated protein 1 isoform X1 [Trichogramma pretiosum]
MSRSEKERAKQIQDKCQALLTQMLRDEDNKYCVDCDAKGPRWASWNLGIFLCIRCAGIHRNLGVHISKVKSVNLDSWTPDQVVSLQQMGNSRARAVYEANLPDSFRRPQTDCSLENFIRAKYEHKKYIAREWVPPVLPKVNWDKELDEEAEKQRRRKKESSQKITSQSTLPPVKKPQVVPQLPKPHSSASQKPNRISSSNNTAILDLLGLDAPENQTSTNGSGSASDDIFTSFLSGPPASSGAPAATNGSSSGGTSSEAKNANNSAKSEEESFFNQTAPTPQEKSKMTKDSILALYAAQPAQPFGGVSAAANATSVGADLNPFTGASLFNHQAAMPAAQQFPQQFASVFNQPTNQHHHLQSQMGGMHHQMNSVGSQMVSNSSLFGSVAANPMMNNSPMTMPQMQQSMTNSAPQMNSNNGWSTLVATQNLQPAPGSNPFLNLSAQQPAAQPFGQLPQQMSQMSLGGMNLVTNPAKPATTSLPGQTLSTNLWQ